NWQTRSRVAELLQILDGTRTDKDTRIGLGGISRRTIFAREFPHFKPSRLERATHIADGRPKPLAPNSCCQAFCKHRCRTERQDWRKKSRLNLFIAVLVGKKDEPKRTTYAIKQKQPLSSLKNSRYEYQRVDSRRLKEDAEKP